MTSRWMLVAALGSLVWACSPGGDGASSSQPSAEEATGEEGEATPEAAPAEAEAAPEAAEPAAPVAPTPDNLVFVRTEIPTMHATLELPERMEQTRATETGAGFSMDVGDYNSVQVSMEPQGASSADEARTFGNIVGSLGVAEVVTMENGNFEVVHNVRESDNRTGVTVFSGTTYAYCNGPAEYLPAMQRMCRSLAPME